MKRNAKLKNTLAALAKLQIDLEKKVDRQKTDKCLNKS
jgi:hypothetical protein